MDFKSFSRVKLPLDDFNRSRLNLIPGKASLVDGTSEDFVDFNKSNSWEVDWRVNLTATITGGLEISVFYVIQTSRANSYETNGVVL